MDVPTVISTVIVTSDIIESTTVVVSEVDTKTLYYTTTVDVDSTAFVTVTEDITSLISYHRRQATDAPNVIPSYGVACGSAGYSSACSCNGVTAPSASVSVSIISSYVTVEATPFTPTVYVTVTTDNFETVTTYSTTISVEEVSVPGTTVYETIAVQATTTTDNIIAVATQYHPFKISTPNGQAYTINPFEGYAPVEVKASGDLWFLDAATGRLTDTGGTVPGGTAFTDSSGAGILVTLDPSSYQAATGIPVSDLICTIDSSSFQLICTLGGSSGTFQICSSVVLDFSITGQGNTECVNVNAYAVFP
jgi:hypothetical protein